MTHPASRASVSRTVFVMPAKPDKRTRTAAQKAKTRRARHARADVRRRTAEWVASAAAARAAGRPINAQLTILADADDIEVVTAAIWRRLRRLMKRNGLPFVAMRAPEYAPKRKHHLHIALHLPELLYGDVAAVLADATGAPMAAWFDARGRRLGRKLHGVICLAPDGSWMIQRHVEGIGGSGERLVTYTAKGSGKHRAIGRHQRSEDLVTLTKRTPPEDPRDTASARTFSQQKSRNQPHRAPVASLGGVGGQKSEMGTQAR